MCNFKRYLNREMEEIDERLNDESDVTHIEVVKKTYSYSTEFAWTPTRCTVAGWSIALKYVVSCMQQHTTSNSSKLIC